MPQVTSDVVAISKHRPLFTQQTRQGLEKKITSKKYDNLLLLWGLRAWPEGTVAVQGIEKHCDDSMGALVEPDLTGCECPDTLI
jgi:hypothetical protein